MFENVFAAIQKMEPVASPETGSPTNVEALPRVESDGAVVLRTWGNWKLVAYEKMLFLDTCPSYPIESDRWHEGEWEEQLSMKNWCQGEHYNNFVHAIRWCRTLSVPAQRTLVAAGRLLRKGL